MGAQMDVREWSDGKLIEMVARGTEGPVAAALAAEVMRLRSARVDLDPLKRTIRRLSELAEHRKMAIDAAAEALEDLVSLSEIEAIVAVLKAAS